MNKFSVLTSSIFSILLLILTQSEVSIAQNPIPNPGFESWIDVNGLYEEPEFWGSQNPYTWSFIETLTKDESSYSGSYAARLATKGHNNTFITGIMCSGTLNVSDFSCNGGFPVDYRFAFFSGYYKYARDTNDMCMIKAWMWKWNTSTLMRDTVATAVFIGDTLTNYQLFIAPFDFKSAEDPDSAMIVVASTDSIFNAPVGSVLLVDDLAFTGSVGIDEVKNNNIVIYPNPANQFLIIQIPEQVIIPVIKIYDLTGRLIVLQKNDRQQININTSQLNNGLYYFMVEGTDGKNISAGKFMVEHKE